MSVGERIKIERVKKHISQASLGEMLNITQQAVGKWEKNLSEPDSAMLMQLADIFEVSLDYLLGRTDSKKEPIIENEIPMAELDMYPIPLLGSVVAGVPIEAQEDLEGYIYINYRPTEEYFALRVHGDSMKNAGIQDKSVLVCHKQSTADNGDIVVAMLNGEQTVKRFKTYGESVFLMPENNDYEPIPVTPKDSFYILGKVVEVRFVL